MAKVPTPMDTPIDVAPAGPAIDDAFVADRQAFWGRFTGFVTYAAVAVAVLLVLLAYFLT